jgi:CheY-like chemotaxis protein
MVVPPPRKRIICVQDQADICKLFTVILEDYEVVSASGVSQAVSRARAEKFDLYLLDYHLPDGTGLDLCVLLRQFDQETPIVFATATSLITEAEVIAAGAQGLIRGGLSMPEDLPAKVSQLLSDEVSRPLALGSRPPALP